LGDVASVVDVQMIAAVIQREQPRRVARVAHNFVEIHDGVEFAASADPRVDLVPRCFFLRREEMDLRMFEHRVLDGGDGGSDNKNPLLMRARDQLAIAGDDALGAHAFTGRYERAREKNVVDAEKKDDVLDASLREHVAIETRKPRIAKSLP